MAAGGETLTGLQDRKIIVRRVIGDALRDLRFIQETQETEITISRDGISYMKTTSPRQELADLSFAAAAGHVSKRLLPEGLGTEFSVAWDHPGYSREDLRVLRRGEPIFDVMRSHNLNPEWDGTMAGEFTITSVDEEGAKLALHPRLDFDSPLSLVKAAWPWSLGLYSLSLRYAELVAPGNVRNV